MNNHGRFSKRVITAMIVLWFVTAVYGMTTETILLFKTPELFTLESLLAYVGVPIGGGIVTYLLKSMFENKEKIKNNSDEFTECGEPIEIGFSDEESEGDTCEY